MNKNLPQNSNISIEIVDDVEKIIIPHAK